VVNYNEDTDLGEADEEASGSGEMENEDRKFCLHFSYQTDQEGAISVGGKRFRQKIKWRNFMSKFETEASDYFTSVQQDIIIEPGESNYYQVQKPYPPTRDVILILFGCFYDVGNKLVLTSYLHYWGVFRQGEFSTGGDFCLGRFSSFFLDKIQSPTRYPALYSLFIENKRWVRVNLAIRTTAH